MPISIDDILNEFINPPKQEKKTFFQKKPSREETLANLKIQYAKSQSVKELLKTPAWRDILREKIIDGLKTGFARLLSPTSLDLKENELKTILARLHAYIGFIADLRYIVDAGDEAAGKIVEIEK